MASKLPKQSGNTGRWKTMAVSGGSVSVLLASLIGYFEGTSYTPYKDVTGVWTNCQGNTHGVDPHKVMDKLSCSGVDADNRQAALNHLYSTVSVPLTRNQQVAFADFIYNEGSGSFDKSTMRTYINTGNLPEACRQLLRWTYAGGKMVGGLINRRGAEYTLCTTDDPS